MPRGGGRVRAAGLHAPVSNRAAAARVAARGLARLRAWQTGQPRRRRVPGLLRYLRRAVRRSAQQGARLRNQACALVQPAGSSAASGRGAAGRPGRRGAAVPGHAQLGQRLEATEAGLRERRKLGDWRAVGRRGEGEALPRRRRQQRPAAGAQERGNLARDVLLAGPARAHVARASPACSCMRRGWQRAAPGIMPRRSAVWAAPKTSGDLVRCTAPLFLRPGISPADVQPASALPRAGRASRAGPLAPGREQARMAPPAARAAHQRALLAGAAGAAAGGAAASPARQAAWRASSWRMTASRSPRRAALAAAASARAWRARQACLGAQEGCWPCQSRGPDSPPSRRLRGRLRRVGGAPPGAAAVRGLVCGRPGRPRGGCRAAAWRTSAAASRSRRSSALCWHAPSAACSCVATPAHAAAPGAAPPSAPSLSDPLRQPAPVGEAAPPCAAGPALSVWPARRPGLRAVPPSWASAPGGDAPARRSAARPARPPQPDGLRAAPALLAPAVRAVPAPAGAGGFAGLVPPGRLVPRPAAAPSRCGDLRRARG